MSRFKRKQRINKENKTNNDKENCIKHSLTNSHYNSKNQKSVSNVIYEKCCNKNTVRSSSRSVHCAQSQSQAKTKADRDFEWNLLSKACSGGGRAASDLNNHKFTPPRTLQYDKFEVDDVIKMIQVEQDEQVLLNEIYIRLRCEMVQWISEACETFKLNMQIYFLAVCYYDRIMLTFMKSKKIEEHHRDLRTIAITCLLLAIKIEGKVYPTCSDLCEYADRCCGCMRSDVIRVEKTLVTLLDWKLRPITVDTLLLYLCQQLAYNNELELIGQQQHLHHHHQSQTHESEEHYSNEVMAATTLDTLATTSSSFSKLKGKRSKKISYFAVCAKQLFSTKLFRSAIEILNLALLDIGWLKFSVPQLAVAAITLIGFENVRMFTHLMEEQVYECVQWLRAFKHGLSQEIFNQNDHQIIDAFSTKQSSHFNEHPSKLLMKHVSVNRNHERFFKKFERSNEQHLSLKWMCDPSKLTESNDGVQKVIDGHEKDRLHARENIVCAFANRKRHIGEIGLNMYCYSSEKENATLLVNINHEFHQTKRMRKSTPS